MVLANVGNQIQITINSKVFSSPRIIVHFS